MQNFHFSKFFLLAIGLTGYTRFGGFLFACRMSEPLADICESQFLVVLTSALCSKANC